MADIVGHGKGGALQKQVQPVEQEGQVKAVGVFHADLHAAVPDGLRHPVTELPEVFQVDRLVFLIDKHPLCRQGAVDAPEHVHIQGGYAQLFCQLHHAQHIFHIGLSDPGVQTAGVQLLIQMHGIENAVPLLYPQQLIRIQLLQLVLGKAHVQFNKLQSQLPAQRRALLKAVQFDQRGHSKRDHYSASR